jgi:glutathione synthase/RimK-type ligase-like ATP-grasp enzyme
MFSEKTTKLILNICQELNIKITLIADSSLILFQKDNIKKSLVKYNFDLNSCTSKMICDDKFLTFSLLSTYNIPIIKSYLMDLIYNRDSVTFERIKEIKEEYKQIVIKSSFGSMGYDVFKCDCDNEVKRVLKYFEDKSINYIVCPYENIEFEARIVILDSSILLTYKKKTKIVIGDGFSTLLELINKNTNDGYSEFLLNNCLNNNIKLNDIPTKGQEINYSWKHNLATGADISLIFENDDEKIINNLAIKTFNVLPNARLVSIDIIKNKNNEFKVLEINSGIMMERFMSFSEETLNITKNIYTQIIKKMMKIT